MKFDFIFNSFSRRGKPAQPFDYKVTDSLRNKILLWCDDTFSNRHNPYGRGDYTSTFWKEIQRILQYRHGRQVLTDVRLPPDTDSKIFLLITCKDEEFIDFIEYIFRVECLFQVANNENDLVAQINQLLSSESLGYVLTEFVKEERVEETQFGRGPVIITIAWPQVIRKDNQVIYDTAIKPVLQLLSHPNFKTANLEYLESLDDYRKGDWGDSLTKCCSAFESVMKIICEKKKWNYSQSDTAGPLIKAIISNVKLEQHFEQPLVFIATLRNKYSKSHGAGIQPRKVTQSIALLGLNLTASAILFLSEETK
jgi:hypothetical protein